MTATLKTAFDTPEQTAWPYRSVVANTCTIDDHGWLMQADLAQSLSDSLLHEYANPNGTSYNAYSKNNWNLKQTRGSNLDRSNFMALREKLLDTVRAGTERRRRLRRIAAPQLRPLIWNTDAWESIW